MQATDKKLRFLKPFGQIVEDSRGSLTNPRKSGRLGNGPPMHSPGGTPNELHGGIL